MTQPDGLADHQYWNRNTHYHPLLLSLTPAARVLDFGCGTGLLTRQLAPLVTEVVGIDPDKPSIAKARSRSSHTNATYIEGDGLSYPFKPESFDLIVSVAAIHHFDATAGLRRFDELLRPGGRLGLVGIPANNYPRDLGREALANSATFIYRKWHRTSVWDHGAPMVWPPPLTDVQMRRLGSEVLPGSTYRRHLHRRYSLIWQKPA